MKCIKLLTAWAIAGFLLQLTGYAQKTATATATVANGYVVSIVVTDGGAGYTNTPSVSIIGGGGEGASAVATVLNGAVNQIFVINYGGGYTSAPQVIIADPPLPKPPYTVEDIVPVTKLSIRGQVGARYWIVSGSSIEDRTTWNIVTNIALASDPFTFVDLAASAARRFYQAFPEEMGPGFAATGFVWIKPGTFTMGSPATEQDRQSNEGPQTKVTITKGFWMSKYEITQAEYQSVMGKNPSQFTGDLQRPVDRVSWIDATNYCSKLTAREQAAGRLPHGFIYRLPTEAEWEYACRAGTTTRFSYGDDPGYTSLGDYAWYGSNSGSQTHPVGQKLPNVWGFYDMHGNVWEWCQDWYGTYPGGNVADPQGPSTGPDRVLRGGGFGYGGGYCRATGRHGGVLSQGFGDVGFRPVLASAQ